MKIVIFGATGMVGRGALLEALDSSMVDTVLTVGRKEAEIAHPKLQQILHSDFENFEAIADQLTDLDACLWCLGVSSAGMSEEDYTRITYDFALNAAKELLAKNPEMRFCFVSGAGADSSEKGCTMWARVKGKTENDLMKMPFKEVVIFRPAFIKAERGSKPRGALYGIMYAIFGVFSPIFRAFGGATSTTEVGQAMVLAAAGESTKQMLDSRDINSLAARMKEVVS